MTNIERVCTFLKEAGTYYLATADKDQPRVRPFGTAHIFEDKLYIQTGLSKDVAKQMAENPKVEICAFKDGVWVRVEAEAVLDERIEAQESMLDDYQSLRRMYTPGDGNTAVYWLKNAKATFSSFTAAPETVTF
ncbi:MAG: pyridoxamine 5'-phosphate oxidase family protein [Solobacterium sp.]|nr:pyridoxamine 5'-phosphate oxidase family protein [Solobacterium sp.]